MLPARYTFPNGSRQICWQKQLRDHFLAEGCPPVPHLSLRHAEIRPVSRAVATQIILRYEWLGTMAQTQFHYGIFFGPYCAGVCCYGRFIGAGVHTHKQFGIAPQALGILARGACTHWAPPGANSKLVSLSARRFLRDSGCTLLLAYSDSEAGEIGTIYQACNWVYIGRKIVGNRPNLRSVQGREINRRVIGLLCQRYGMTWESAKHSLWAAGWQERAKNPKGRYVFTRDPRLRQRLERLRVPYPKRPTSIESDASFVQEEECGATPTVGLLTEEIALP